MFILFSINKILSAIMLNYKLVHHKSNPKLQHFNHFSQVKLPNVEKRVADPFKKSMSKIKSSKSPLLNFHETNIINHQNIKKSGQNSQLQSRTDPSGETTNMLVANIGQKVNQMLNKNNLFNMDYYMQQTQNFQLNIAKNKQYLKEQREKRVIFKKKDNQSSEKKDHQQQDNPKEDSHAKNKKKDQKRKITSRNKKKNFSPSIGNSRSESVLTNDEQNLQRREKGGVTNRLQKKMQQLKNKLSKRKNESKFATEGDVEDIKSQNLFDNIHNYLANPHRLSFDIKTNTKDANTKKINLQNKLKQLEQKLSQLQKGKPEKEQQIEALTHRTTRRGEDYGMSDWRRIQFYNTSDNRMKNMSMRQSNFEKEVNQINILQQRNQRSLQKYLQNQRMLFDLKFIKNSSDKLTRQFRSK